MILKFTLCPQCTEKYRALRYDVNATFWCSSIPLCCIFWRDEHPEGEPIGRRHDTCRDSLVHLSDARMSLWLTGCIRNELQPVWTEAQLLMPDWPGFQRLKIDAKQHEALKGCVSELEDLQGAITKDFPNIAIEQRPDGMTTFRAWRRFLPKRRQWWRFW